MKETTLEILGTRLSPKAKRAGKNGGKNGKGCADSQEVENYNDTLDGDLVNSRTKGVDDVITYCTEVEGMYNCVMYYTCGVCYNACFVFSFVVIYH